MFKSKIRTLLKRVVSTAAAAVMMATTVIPSAAAKDIEYDWDSTSNLIFTKSFSAVSDGRGSITGYKTKMVAFKAKDEKYFAMCALPGTGFDEDYKNIDGVMIIPHMDEGEYWEEWYKEDDNAWQKDLTRVEKQFVALCSYYGYPNAYKSKAYFYATQALTWEIVMGYRTCNKDNGLAFLKTYNGIKPGKYAYHRQRGRQQKAQTFPASFLFQGKIQAFR